MDSVSIPSSAKSSAQPSRRAGRRGSPVLCFRVRWCQPRSTFDAEYEGDEWDIDLDCGAAGRHQDHCRGSQGAQELRGFNPFTIRALMKKYKVELSARGPVELVKRGDPYASIVSQARLLDGSIWKILDDQPDNFEVVTRIKGPMEKQHHERTIIKVPNDPDP